MFSMLPTFLVVEHGHSERSVKYLVGVSRITGFAAIFTAGALSDRFGFAAVVSVIMSVTGVMTVLIGLTHGTVLLIAGVSAAPCRAGLLPGRDSALTDTAPVAARNLAVALAIPMANLVGAGIAPRAFGAVAAAGYFEAGFIALGTLTVASLALLPLRRAKQATPGTTPA
ncbi:MFS transporter [Halomonas sp.]|uniref:MFS transporter n=1 Tax=Halomonas sp. TaxID=1486246 RepID=UPI003A10140B